MVRLPPCRARPLCRSHTVRGSGTRRGGVPPAERTETRKDPCERYFGPHLLGRLARSRIRERELHPLHRRALRLLSRAALLCRVDRGIPVPDPADTTPHADRTCRRVCPPAGTRSPYLLHARGTHRTSGACPATSLARSAKRRSNKPPGDPLDLGHRCSRICARAAPASSGTTNRGGVVFSDRQLRLRREDIPHVGLDRLGDEGAYLGR